MLQRLVDDAGQRTTDINFKATVDKSRKRKHVGIAFAVIALCGLLALIFPSAIHTALSRVLFPWEPTEHILTTKLNVQPGNARILRGQSLPINVEITGKAADKVTLVYTQVDPEPTVEGEAETSKARVQEINMLQIEGEKRKFGYEIFNISENLTYHVVANDTESERFTIQVFDMPKVTGIEVAYTYPEYTQLKPIVQQGDGDIRALVGSQAEVRVTMNKAIQSATLTVEGQQPASMLISEGTTLTWTLDVLADGKYNIGLLCVDGFKNQTPIEYLITALPDDPPQVVIKEPGKDVKATKLEEIGIVAEAVDDYGIEQLTLKYSVGSGEIRELPMETPGVKARQLATGSYAFYLEEMDVEAGEVISYYAEARDNNRRTGPGIATSEIYFIEVRPFNERYTEMEAEGQPMQPMPPVPPMCGKVIGTEKQIIRETWAHTNSRPAPVTDDYRMAVKKTAEKQSKLRDSAQEFVDQVSGVMRTGEVDPEILLNMEDALAEMRDASDKLYAIKPREALPHEHEALELVVKVCQELPKALTRMRQSGQQQAADNIEMELEDLESSVEADENELDEQMREQTQEMLDRAEDMLAEQQQLTEQGQQMGRESQPSQQEMQQNSQQQGQLGQQAQQMAQQLAQMGQQAGQSSQGQRMGQAGEAMQQASEEMEQASQSMEQKNPQMSAAKGQQAEENLRQAIDELERAASQFSDEALAQKTEQLDQLIEEQSEVQEQTETLNDRTQESGIRAEDLREASRLANQQRQLRRDAEALQEDLEELQAQLNENSPQAAENVGDASRRMVEEQVPENMASAQRGLQWRSFRTAEQDQQEAINALQQARDDLRQARANMAETEAEQLETALEQLEGWEEQMRDIQRQLQAMENQNTPLTPEQQQQQEQLSQQQEQIRQRMQQAQQAMEGPTTRPAAGARATTGATSRSRTTRRSRRPTSTSGRRPKPKNQRTVARCA